MGKIPPPIILKKEDFIIFFNNCESGWKPKNWETRRRKFVEWFGSLSAYPDWFNYRVYLNMKGVIK